MILKDLVPFYNGPGADAEVTGITADSRRVQPGYVFAAMQGVVADGRKFIPSAVENGAIAVLGEDLPEIGGVARVEVENARLALAEASARFYPTPPEQIVAITGTNGKSSTVEFLRQRWRAAGQ